MVSGGAMLVGTMAGGFLGDIDLALPYVVRALMLVAVFIVAWLTMHDLGFTPRTLRWNVIPREMERVAAESVRYGWDQRPVRLLTFVSFLQFGFMSWGFYAWQPYFLELLGRDAVWVAGAAASAIAGAMILGNAIVDRPSRFCGRRTTLLLWAAGAQSAAAVAVGFTDDFWTALAAMVVLATAIGVTGPVKQAYLHASVPSAQRGDRDLLRLHVGQWRGRRWPDGAGVALPGPVYRARVRGRWCGDRVGRAPLLGRACGGSCGGRHRGRPSRCGRPVRGSGDPGDRWRRRQAAHRGRSSPRAREPATSAKRVLVGVSRPRLRRPGAALLPPSGVLGDARGRVATPEPPAQRRDTAAERKR